MVICADLLDVLIVLDMTRFCFYIILKVRTPECRRVRDLSMARHTGFLAALSRDGLDSEQEINDAHVCSRHFMSGSSEPKKDAQVIRVRGAAAPQVFLTQITCFTLQGRVLQ